MYHGIHLIGASDEIFKQRTDYLYSSLIEGITSCRGDNKSGTAEGEEILTIENKLKMNGRRAGEPKDHPSFCGWLKGSLL